MPAGFSLVIAGGLRVGGCGRSHRPGHARVPGIAAPWARRGFGTAGQHGAAPLAKGRDAFHRRPQQLGQMPRRRPVAPPCLEGAHRQSQHWRGVHPHGRPARGAPADTPCRAALWRWGRTAVESGRVDPWVLARSTGLLRRSKLMTRSCDEDGGFRPIRALLSRTKHGMGPRPRGPRTVGALPLHVLLVTAVGRPNSPFTSGEGHPLSSAGETHALNGRVPLRWLAKGGGHPPTEVKGEL